MLKRLQGAWSWYQTQLAKNPVRTQIATSALLWGAGDAVAQRVDMVASEKRRKRQGSEAPVPSVAGRSHYQTQQAESCDEQQTPAKQEQQKVSREHTDLTRVCTTSLFGAAFVGPVGHFWYAGLEQFVKNRLHLRPKTTSFIVAKLALDTFIFGPVHLVAFFSWTGLVSGHSLQRIKKDVARDFVPAFLTEATVWPLIQFGNFRYVPVRHQLLFVNVFCLLDSAWLSWLKYEQDAQWKVALSKMMTWHSEA